MATKFWFHHHPKWHIRIAETKNKRYLFEVVDQHGEIQAVGHFCHHPRASRCGGPRVLRRPRLGQRHHRDGRVSKLQRTAAATTLVNAGIAVLAFVGGHLHGRSVGPVSDGDVRAIVDHLTAEEGFRGSWYTDTLGNPTIGYGFTNMTEPEARAVLEIRVDSLTAQLARRWEPYASRPDSVKVALADMSYQLGVEGLLRFDTMLRLIANDSLPEAVQDALTTAWARQTPHRAQRVVRLLQGAGGG